MKLDWKVGLGLAVSAFLLWWVFRGEDLGAIARQLASADPVLLAASALLSVSSGLVRALRWRLLLEPLGVEATLNARWKALNIGFMANNVVGARIGEIVRPFALSRLAPVSTSGALGTVVLERVLDTIALLLLLVVTLLSPAFPSGATVMGQSIGFAVAGIVAVAVGALLVIAFVIFNPNRARSAVQWVTRWLPGDLGAKATDGVDAFLGGLGLVRHPAAFMKAMVWSVGLWIWIAASFWAAFQAFGIELGATAAMFTACAVSLFVALPAAPGFIGTLQAGVSVSVQDIFGVAAEPTLSMAVGYHLAGFIPVTLLGLYYAWSLGLRVGSMQAEAQTSMDSDSPESIAATEPPGRAK